MKNVKGKIIGYGLSCVILLVFILCFAEVIQGNIWFALGCAAAAIAFLVLGDFIFDQVCPGNFDQRMRDQNKKNRPTTRGPGRDRL